MKSKYLITGFAILLVNLGKQTEKQYINIIQWVIDDRCLLNIDLEIMKIYIVFICI